MLHIPPVHHPPARPGFGIEAHTEYPDTDTDTCFDYRGPAS